MIVVKTGGSPMKRPTKSVPKLKWTCKCPATHPPYLVSCSRCREKRTV